MAKGSKLRKTKIVATVGPASDAMETLKEMIAAGMNVARLNLSFGTLPEHKERIERIRAAAEQLRANIAIMIDTRGIEIRTGKMKNGAVDLTRGSSFMLYTDGRIGDATGVSISYKKLPEEISIGVPILIDDGAIELEVESTSRDAICCRVVHGATLRDNKRVNLPAVQLSAMSKSPEHYQELVRELNFAAENAIDYIAASFVQSGDDVLRMQEVLQEKHAGIPIIAKIENKAGG